MQFAPAIRLQQESAIKTVLKIALLAIPTFLFALPSFAQTHRLGLWEQWTQPKVGGSGEMAEIVKRIDESNRKFKEKLAAMEPEKRQAIERELAASGVDLRLDKPDGVMSVQFCMTAKEAARLEALKQSPECKRTVTSETDGIVVVQLQCTEKAGRPPTIATVTYYGDKAFTTSFPMATMAARWLRDDCGNVGK